MHIPKFGATALFVFGALVSSASGESSGAMLSAGPPVAASFKEIDSQPPGEQEAQKEPASLKQSATDISETARGVAKSAEKPLPPRR